MDLAILYKLLLHSTSSIVFILCKTDYEQEDNALCLFMAGFEIQ